MQRIRKKKWIHLFVGSCILFLLWEFHQNRKVELCIPSIQGKNYVLIVPWKDKKNLDYLFRTMFALDSGSYTLFGSKPMSMSCYLTPFSTTSLVIFLESLSPKNLRIYWGWKTWEKYQNLLAKSEFLLWAEENPFWLRWFQPPSASTSILMVHKERLREMIDAHIADFQTVLNRKTVTCEQLLLEARNKPFLKEVLKDHDGLIGTLFGYGRNNAWLFEERNQGKKVPLVSMWGEEVYVFFKNRPTPNWLIYGFDSEDLSENLNYPCFLANPDSLETQELKRKFLDTREKILNYYKNKDFLETTLGLLITGGPDSTIASNRCHQDEHLQGFSQLEEAIVPSVDKSYSTSEKPKPLLHPHPGKRKSQEL